MLKSLSVTNLAVVERAEAEFAPGLNVLTGETGAGKSVLAGAIELVLGARADASAVRDGAKEAEVEADFGDHVARRTVSANGHSRAWIDDEAVSISDLKAFGRTRVDMHGPRSNQLLLEERFQRDALDAFGKIDLSAYSKAWAELVQIRSEIDRLKDAGADEDALDLLRYQIGELGEAGLTSEDEDLAERHAAAAHAQDILGEAERITGVLGADGGAADIVAGLAPAFTSMARHFPAASAWADEAAEITVRIQELSRSIADATAAIDADPAAFEEMDARLGVVNRLKRKYLKSGGSIADLTALYESKKKMLDDLEGRDAAMEKLRLEEKTALAEVEKLGAALMRARSAAGARFAKAVTKELKSLGFLQAAFSVELKKAEPSAAGCDTLAYLFEPNPGESARPLADIASSGEIARVMLALKALLARHDSTDTLVFDEIDANIGGETGKAVGERLREVARHRQVIAITHLPQSAVFADRHLVAVKRVSAGRTRTSISVVEGEEREAEIARMLGGENLTSVVKRHAKELLKLAQN